MKKERVALLMVLLNFFLSSQNHLMAAIVTSSTTQQTSGLTSTQQQQAAASGEALVTSQNTVLILAATTTTLSTAAQSLSLALSANSSIYGDMNYLYGTTINATGTHSDYDRSTLNGIVTQNGYVQSAFIASMRKSTSLVRALRLNTTARSSFNRGYATTITASGTPTAANRASVHTAVTRSYYNEANFLNLLTTWSTGTAPLWEMAMALQGSSQLRADFNLLYAAAVPASGTLSTSDRSKLSSVVLQSGWEKWSYLTRQTRAASLYRALQQNSTYRTKFNSVYGATIQSSGSPSSADRTTLFEVVSPSNYDQAAFLASLSLTAPPALPGRMFSPTSIWNTKLSSTHTIHSNSTNLVTELVRNTTLGGGPYMNSTSYSTPYYVVGAGTAKKPVYLNENGFEKVGMLLYIQLAQGVPLPANVKPAAGTDGHVTIYDSSTDTLYEFWKFRYANGRYEASWGGILRNASTSSGIMPTPINQWGNKERWGATATGLPAIAGTMMLKELQAGVIPHMLAFAIPQAKNTYVSPANSSDGNNTSANAIPQGSRFRLPANVYIDPTWSPLTKMIVAAVRDYGMILRDTAGAVVFVAEDTTPYISGNPYTAFLDGDPLYESIRDFPFSQLKALA